MMPILTLVPNHTLRHIGAIDCIKLSCTSLEKPPVV